MKSARRRDNLEQTPVSTRFQLMFPSYTNGLCHGLLHLLFFLLLGKDKKDEEDDHHIEIDYYFYFYFYFFFFFFEENKKSIEGEHQRMG